MVFLRPSSPRTFINNFLSASLIIYFLANYLSEAIDEKSRISTNI